MCTSSLQNSIHFGTSAAHDASGTP
jgi:hypothetical protein